MGKVLMMDQTLECVCAHIPERLKGSFQRSRYIVLDLLICTVSTEIMQKS